MDAHSMIWSGLSRVLIFLIMVSVYFDFVPYDRGPRNRNVRFLFSVFQFFDNIFSIVSASSSGIESHHELQQQSCTTRDGILAGYWNGCRHSSHFIAASVVLLSFFSTIQQIILCHSFVSLVQILYFFVHSG